MNNKLLIVILLLASFLRFYKLASFPVSLSWDEAAIGYDAFSIAKTGHDQYGKKFPILFQSFNDYKLPGYIYVDSIFVKAFDLSEFWVRFPSAIFGTFAVFLIYLLFSKILDRKIALSTSFLMAISPWHLQFSRAAFESNAALTIVLLGLTLIFYGFKNKISALLSIPALSLSLYFYYSPRIFAPLILIIIALVYKDKIAKNLKYFLAGTFTAGLILIPIALMTLSAQGLKRVQEVSIFTDRSIIEPYVLAKASSQNPLAGIFLNRRIPLAFETLHDYFSHFSPGFLFFGDDPNPRHRSVFHGNLYTFEMPLLALGLWALLKRKEKSKLFILSWLLIAPIPAGLAREFPHGLRALLMLPAVLTLSGIGLTVALKLRFAKFMIPLALAIFVINYLFTYYIVYPKTSGSAWAYGYKQAFSQTSVLDSSYDRIIFTGSYWKPYIFYLFYNKIDPDTFAKNRSETKIGKYRFGVAAWDGGKNLDLDAIEGLKSAKTLLVVSPQELVNLNSNEKFTILKTIYDYSGKAEVFKIGKWQ